MLYLVSYDISKDEDRNAVISKLKEISEIDAKSVLESSWIIDKENTDSQQLCAIFKEIIGKKDRLFINSLDPSNMKEHNPVSGIRAHLVSRVIRKAKEGT